jgi:hypothetical protein
LFLIFFNHHTIEFEYKNYEGIDLGFLNPH